MPNRDLYICSSILDAPGCCVRWGNRKSIAAQRSFHCQMTRTAQLPSQVGIHYLQYKYVAAAAATVGRQLHSTLGPTPRPSNVPWTATISHKSTHQLSAQSAERSRATFTRGQGGKRVCHPTKISSWLKQDELFYLV